MSIDKRASFKPQNSSFFEPDSTPMDSHFNMQDKLNRSSLFKKSLREVTNNSTLKSSKNSEKKSIGLYLTSKTIKPSQSTTPRNKSTRQSPRDETYAVNYPIPIIYKDGLNELFIEKNRNRINIRELNAHQERLSLLKKTQSLANKDLDQTHVSKKLSTLSLLSIPGVPAEEKAVEFGKLADKTYDDQGQTFKIQHLNTEKLPKLIAINEMKIRLPSTNHTPADD